MTPAQLKQLGPTIYRDNWRQRLARDLDVSYGTVIAWSSGRMPMRRHYELAILYLHTKTTPS